MVGSVPVNFAGNAATTYRYKSLFGRDLMKAFVEQGTNLDTDMIFELAFTMHLQAEGYKTEQFSGVTYEDYLDWMEHYDFVDLVAAAPEIIKVWADTSKISSKAKKK